MTVNNLPTRVLGAVKAPKNLYTRTLIQNTMKKVQREHPLQFLSKHRHINRESLLKYANVMVSQGRTEMTFVMKDLSFVEL